MVHAEWSEDAAVGISTFAGSAAAAAVVLFATIAGCGGGGEENNQNCKTGDVQACTCPDGSDGTRECRQTGDFGSCRCGGDAGPAADTVDRDADAGGSESTIMLPIEVIGSDGYTESVEFEVDQAKGVTRLYLEVHRPAYRDAAVESGRKRGPKASVQLNDGEWIGLTNDRVTCLDHEAEFGCLHGQYHTLRFTLPIEGVESGSNRLSFRFNGTDGITSGYRVLAFNLERDDGEQVLPESLFEQVDPTDWEPPMEGSDAVEAGRKLWNEAKLVDSPQGDAQKATCSGCHARDGRDLEYYSYSNWSIIVRSKFHGLSGEEGRKIASYIRSHEAERRGRPWNPPFQPGPGLDDKPPEAWAAGAGLDAVLENDEQMVSHLFPNGISKGALAPDEIMNVREQPIALQLPDWNAWLSNTHPVDAWGDTFLETAKEEDNWRRAVLRNLKELRQALRETGPDELAKQGGGPHVSELVRLMKRFSQTDAHFTREYLDEISGERKRARAQVGLRKWQSVKLWSMFQKHRMQDLADEMYGSTGEPRSWAGASRTVFDVPPHISGGVNGNHWRHQTFLAGKTSSTAWYQLQLILDSGNGEGGAISPVDWNYHPSHISDLTKRGNDVEQPMRMAQAYAKMLEQQSIDRPLDTNHFHIGQMHPYRFTGLMDTIDDPELKADVETALLGALMDKFDSHSMKEWNAYRKEHLKESNNLKPADHVPTYIDDVSAGDLHGEDARWVDAWYSLISEFRADGVDEAVLERMITWGEKMWPKGDWDAVRPGGRYATP